jgi:hypothetical protein
MRTDRQCAAQVAPVEGALLARGFSRDIQKRRGAPSSLPEALLLFRAQRRGLDSILALWVAALAATFTDRAQRKPSCRRRFFFFARSAAV